MIDQSTYYYIMDKPHVISLYLNLPDRYIYIHNFYNPVNIEETNKSILILKYRLSAHLNKKHIILEDFNFHHKAWGRPGVSKTPIKKLKELLIVTQR